MSSLNKAMIIGFLGRDPEMKYTPGGQAVTQFSVATSRNFKKDDQWAEETEWHSVVVWGQLAERMADRLRKGHKVYVEGRLQTRNWEKDGTKHYKTEIVAAVVTPLDKREPGAESAGEFDRNSKPEGYEPKMAPAGAPSGGGRPPQDEGDLEDLPF